ncbi:probable basic-leucine zipper transcription factor N isoform X2 [Condylostylus longicornis]|uniref:probable basic-leucine zipper transcription factor N isoform X2 n=1 Tax=Condylostylus longicornis TaxID=2530218 RepID=UPI00244E3DF9|nr:probable basic-leucine zipper transcription factor N isoform X2 [Condylostylus longicornis]
MSYLEWDCIQGANYLTPILPITSINHLKDSTSELKRYSENVDIIQLSQQTFSPENFNFPITPYPYAQQLQPQQTTQQEQIQQQEEPQKIDYENFLCDFNSTAYEKPKEECLSSPTPSSPSSSAYEESSESERGDEIVDEILRIHTKNLPDFNDDNDSQYSSSSFSSASDDSYKINSVNSMSPISNHDWPLLSTSDEYSSQENLQKINDKTNDFNGGQTIKKRSRLYVRNVDEKKSRKKEQNKNAATRYRQKKKMEMKLDLDEERGLLDKNNGLRKTFEEYQREVKYLKKLIKEFYKNDKK